MAGELRGHGLRSTLAAQDRILHREIFPATITARRVDVARFEILDEVLEMGVTVFVEDNVSELDIEDLTCQYAVAFAHNPAFLQVLD